MDALALPILGILVIVLMVYVWNSWLKNKDDRAISTNDIEETDDFPTP